MRTIKTLLGLVAVVALISSAHAADATAAAGAGKHKDQYAALDAQLTELDKNHDGRLDDGEIRGALRAVKKLNDPRISAMLDADKDGKIDHHEMKKFLDTDMDGKIDHGEARRFLISIKEKDPDLYAKIAEMDVPKPHANKTNK